MSNEEEITPWTFEDNPDLLPQINCSQFSVADISNLRPMVNTLSVFHVNIRSCRENFHMLEALLSSSGKQFDIIALTETWLSSNVDHTYDILGYNVFNLYRDGRGGGIKIYVRRCHTAKLINNLTFISDYCEILTLNIHNSNINFNVSCVYRPPSVNIHDFNTEFSENILSILANANSLLVGDFNINLYNPRKQNYIDDFITTLSGYNFFPLISLPTRYSPNNPLTKFSLIDHIWSNFSPDNKFEAGVVEFEVADHLPIFCSFEYLPNASLFYYTRNFTNTEKVNDFINKANNINFYNCNTDDPEDMATHFSNNMYDIFNTSFPLCKRKIREKCRAKWMNDDVKSLINKKHNYLCQDAIL